MIARFLTRDPVREYFNPYAYVQWNPVSFRDPTGMQREMPRFELAEQLVEGDPPEEPPAGTRASVGAVAVGHRALMALQAATMAVINYLWQNRNANVQAPTFFTESGEKDEDAEVEGEGSAAEDAGDRNPADDRRLSEKEIKEMVAFDPSLHPHDQKGERGGRLDYFADKKGNVYIKPKDGKGPGEPLGVNIKDIMRRR